MGYITNITSRQNQLITETLKLKQKKYRDEKSLFFFEGKKLFLEAISNKADIDTVFVTENNVDLYKSYADEYDFKLYSVSESVYDKLTNEKAPEGIFTICNINVNKVRDDGIILILDSIQDPGNIGTILRSADAFLCKQVICSSGCTDVYSDKAIRASMGSIFRMSVKTNCDLNREINCLKQDGYEVYASLLDKNAIKLGSIEDYSKKAFVIGNEGNGVSCDVKKICTHSVYIPMGDGTCESLNASVAASIILYKASEKILMKK